MVSTSSTPTHFPDPIKLLLAFVQLFRLPVGILAALAGCATLYTLNPGAAIVTYFLTAIILVCMMSAACAINDYWDVDKDRIDHPERPLPSHTLSRQQVWWAAVIMFAVALIAAIPLGYPVLLVGLSVGLLWNYSQLLRYNGILGNFVVATIVAALILLASWIAGRPGAMLYPAGVLFGYTLAKEIIWDIHDAPGDRAQGIMTVANQWGDRTAFRIAWTFLGLLVLSMSLVYLLPMAHPLAFVICLTSMLLCLSGALIFYQRERTTQAYQRFVFWERISMAFGVLTLLVAAPV